MATPRILSLLAVTTLLAAAPRPASAQEPAKGTVAHDAWAAILRLRVAVQAGNWDSVRRYLPASGPWTETVQRFVSSGPADANTFWNRGSTLVPDSLGVVTLGTDRVAVSGPFIVNGQRGFWSAVLRYEGARWKLECTAETWGHDVRRTDCKQSTRG